MASIEKRGESSYRLTVSCGYDNQGKKIIKRRTVDLSHIKPNKQLEEANKQWILFKDEVEKGIYLDAGKITFEEFIRKWLKDYAEPTLAPKTLFSYKDELERRIIPALGHIKLNRLQPTHLTEFYNNLREPGIRLDKKYVAKVNFFDILTELGFKLHDVVVNSKISKGTATNLKNHKNISFSVASKISEALNMKVSMLFDVVEKSDVLSERTILYNHRIISSILTSAVQWQFILNNPALRVKPPKVDKKEARHFDTEQVQYIIDLIEKEHIKHRAMIYLCIFSGVRAGELNGLEWSDIDWANNEIWIHQASQYLPGKGVFTKSTKNESSERDITLPQTVMDVLKEYKLWQDSEREKLGNLWVNSNRLFTKLNGEPIFPDTLGKWFSKFILRHNIIIMNDDTIPTEDKKKYLLDSVNFHGLRHTNASLLIGQGVNIATVSGILGHADKSTTLKIYTHAFKKANKYAADKLENLLSKKKQG